jgi:transposase
MIGELGPTRVYAYCEPTDMRKGHAGLAALVRQALGRDPLSGALFLFTNRRRTHAKILWFDGTGLCMYAKRLEKGRFAALWNVTTRKQIALKRSELQLFLEGSHLVGRISVSPDNLSPSDLVPRPRV